MHPTKPKHVNDIKLSYLKIKIINFFKIIIKIAYTFRSKLFKNVGGLIH
jgi:hypothetical protein